VTKKDSLKKQLKVVVGLSGGVDSSVSAYLLKEQGYDVTGVYMQCWDNKADGCTADEDKSYAVQTSAKLGIPFIHLDFISDYKNKVIEYFYNEYKAGRTPNPDVMCNKEIKFGLFYDWAMRKGYDFVATGHYARNINKDTKHYLLKGVDPKKDQTYFLYLLDQEKLAHILFPVGDLIKTEVRKLAEKEELPSYKRTESMGICFIGEVDIKKFLQSRLPIVQGKVLYIDGSEIGTHEGAWFYTIGQRHGFNITKYFGKPLYIVEKDTVTNTITVGEETTVYKKYFTVSSVHWITDDPFLTAKKTIVTGVRIRHLGQIYIVNVTKNDNQTLSIVSEVPIFGVAPGQCAVFYADEITLGGGVIN
jgi:tRNA-uridine 2-sulfurtransferase